MSGPLGSDSWGNIERDGDLYDATDVKYANNGRQKSRTRAKREDLAKTILAPEKRGMGSTGLTKRYLSDAEKMTMCLLRGKGLTNVEIAEKLKRSEQVVCNVFSQIERMAQSQGLNYDWREDLNTRAVKAIRAGLDSEEDQYKRAKIGIETLKGTGEFEREGGINFTNLVNGIPESARERYISIEPETPSLPPAEQSSGNPESGA